MSDTNIKQNRSIGIVGNKLIERTNSLTLIYDSKDYLEAGIKLNQTYENKVSKPVYFLVLRSIELGFKALIKLHEGVGINAIKYTYKHNLKLLMNTCTRKKYIALRADLSESINLINDFYSKKELEYTKIGYRTIPNISLLIELSKLIHTQFHEVAIDKKKKHYI